MAERTTMPKRNSTATAIENLNAADIVAADAKANLLATIPDPIFRSDIPFVNVWQSKKLNVRDDESYGYAANKGLHDSLKEFGLQKRNPMMSFSLQADKSFLVISGNLRSDRMRAINEETTEQRTKAGLTTTAGDLPFNVIHGLVWTGLSPDQEKALIADDQVSKALNEFEIARAIGEFWEVNPKMTDARASIFFGMDKNKVRRLRMRYSMPTVFAEFRKEKSKSDAPFVKVGNVALDALYTAYLADIDAGNNFRQEGPNFNLAWTTLLAKPDAFSKREEKIEDPSKDRDVVENQSKGSVAAFGDTPEIQAIANALLWTIGANGSDGQPVNLNNVQAGIKAYCDGLRADRDMLATVQAEHATLKAEVDAINATLRDAKPSKKNR